MRSCAHRKVHRHRGGPGWTDVEDIELPRLPDVGESLETKFGTLLVAEAEEAPDLATYAGRIVCRFSYVWSVRPVELVFLVGWAAFWLFWFLAAFSMKRGRVQWSRELRIRAVIFAVVVVLLSPRRVPAATASTTDPWREAVGLVLFALGLGFAIWARVHIGRNWGTPMTQKAEPELVTSGPYRLVRHPIYSGILAAGHRHGPGAELVLARPGRPGRLLLRLRRDRRGALSGRAVPGYLPGVQALHQDAGAVRVLM